MKRLQLAAVALGIMCLAVYMAKSNKRRHTDPISEPQVRKYDTMAEALSKISSDSAKRTVEFLASDDLEGRMSGKKGNVRAADFVKDSLESSGYRCSYQRFAIARVNPGPNKEDGDDFTQNVVAWSDGKDPALRDEIVVVGAHMDHIGYGPRMSNSSGKMKVHPGADDNASGTAALLEIAKCFSNLQNKRTMLFIAFSAEEMGLLGSKHYVDHPMLPESSPSIRKHVFMLNMDMVGYLKKGRIKAAMSSDSSSVDITRYIGELGERYPFAKGITTRSSGGSDHASFYNKRIPVAFLHTGAHDYYHTPLDTADRLNYAGIESISKYASELLWKVCQEDRVPVFNHADFKQMPTDHDHGINKFEEDQK